MNWRAQPKRSIAYSDCDYMITWAPHPSIHDKDGNALRWYNAYTPGTKKRPERLCIEAGFDLQACKAACEAHYAKHGEKVAA
jgi:hypothetical protein